MTEPMSDESTKTARVARLSGSARMAAEARQITCVFQPIMDLSSGMRFGSESLMRCSVPGLASPLELLAAAEREGSIGIVGREARRVAFAARKSGTIFFNIHPDEFDDSFLTRPDDPIFHHPDRVYLEITESAPLHRYRFAKEILAELRARGIGIAVDDFGAGHSNIAAVVDLAPDIVKLDRSLITAAQVGTRRFRLLRSLVALCADQGAEVVAEGIETADELEAVVEAGVPYGQGYFLGKPVAPS